MRAPSLGKLPQPGHRGQLFFRCEVCDLLSNRDGERVLDRDQSVSALLDRGVECAFNVGSASHL